MCEATGGALFPVYDMPQLEAVIDSLVPPSLYLTIPALCLEFLSHLIFRLPKFKLLVLLPIFNQLQQKSVITPQKQKPLSFMSNQILLVDFGVSPRRIQ